MQDLTGILLKFRTHKKAFSADIEKAFLQIELNSLDRDATRFLWLKDINKPVDSKSNLEAYRFCRVLFGATPSPFLLNATIQYHLSQKDNWVARDLMENMYMDNVITGTDCDNKSLEYYSLSRRYLQEAGMNLRQWTSNSEALNRKAQEDHIQAHPTTKILGLTWNSTSDTLSLSIEKMIRERDAITKKKIRVRSARIFKLEDRGYLRVARDVKQPQDLVQEIEPEEQAGDLLIGEALLKEDEEDLLYEQLRNTSAAYLLRIKETYNLSQKALDNTVQLTGTRQHEGQEDCSVSSLILFSSRF